MVYKHFINIHISKFIYIVLYLLFHINIIHTLPRFIRHKHRIEAGNVHLLINFESIYIFKVLTFPYVIHIFLISFHMFFKLTYISSFIWDPNMCVLRHSLVPLVGDGLSLTNSDREGRKQQNSPRVRSLCPWIQLEGKSILTDATIVYPVIQSYLQWEKKKKSQEFRGGKLIHRVKCQSGTLTDSFNFCSLFLLDAVDARFGDVMSVLPGTFWSTNSHCLPQSVFTRCC